jgi:hypothetical protein
MTSACEGNNDRWRSSRVSSTLAACYDHGSSTARFPSSGEVAQLVEHTTENRSVDGSIPPLATINFQTNTNLR